jgi:hypothetical protein
MIKPCSFPYSNLGRYLGERQPDVSFAGASERTRKPARRSNPRVETLTGVADDPPAIRPSRARMGPLIQYARGGRAGS